MSAGGSTFFDLVVERLGPPSDVADRVLLRSGRYVAHDAGENEGASPFAHHDPDRRFRSAIEAWGAVLSRPEPDLAILNFGRRDVPSDQGLPMPFSTAAAVRRTPRHRGRVGRRTAQRPARLLPDASDIAIEPGDLVGCGVSHPCTAFDKWRVIPVLDDDDRVIDAVATYF